MVLNHPMICKPLILPSSSNHFGDNFTGAFRAQGNPQDTTWTGPGSVLGSRHYAVAGFLAGCPVRSDPLDDVLWCFFKPKHRFTRWLTKEFWDMFTPKLGGWTWFLIFKGENFSHQRGILTLPWLWDILSTKKKKFGLPNSTPREAGSNSPCNVRKQIKGIPKPRVSFRWYTFYDSRNSFYLVYWRSLRTNPIHLCKILTIWFVTTSQNVSPPQNWWMIRLRSSHRFRGETKTCHTCVSWHVCQDFCAVIFVAGLDLQLFLYFAISPKLAVRLRAEFPRRRMVGQSGR